MKKNNIYLLLLAMIIGMIALLGDMYGFIDKAMVIILIIAAGGFLLTYMFIKYSLKIKERKNNKNKKK